MVGDNIIFLFAVVVYLGMECGEMQFMKTERARERISNILGAGKRGKKPWGKTCSWD